MSLTLNKQYLNISVQHPLTTKHLNANLPLLFTLVTKFVAGVTSTLSVISNDHEIHQMAAVCEFMR